MKDAGRAFGDHLRAVRLTIRDRNPFGMTQKSFAKRFGLSFGAVRDAERNRVRPSRPLRALLAAIEIDPALIDRAVAYAVDQEAEGQLWAKVREFRNFPAR